MLSLRYTLLVLISMWISSFFSYAYAALNHELEPPYFSHESGFYAEEFDLVLSHPDPEVRIYYTLDGSDPDPENLNGSTFRYKNEYAQPPATEPIGEFFYQEYKTHLYTKPLHIVDRTFEPDRMSQISTTFDEKPTYFPKPVAEVDENGKETGRMKYLFKGTPVKAVTVTGDNEQQSKIVSKVYFIGDQKDFSLPIINITVPEKDLFDYDEGIFVAGIDYDQWIRTGREIPGAKHHRPANWKRKGDNILACLNIFDYGEHQVSQKIDIRLNGEGSRAKSNKSIRVYPRKKYNQNGIQYPIFNDDFLLYFNRIILRNSGNGSSGLTLLSDAAVQKSVQNLNFGTQKYRPYVIFINGEYYGILNARDRVDKFYIKSTFNIPTTSIDFLERKNTVKHGDNKRWNDFISFLENTNASSENFYDTLCFFIDDNSFLDYYCTELYIANTDWPAKNIGFWRYSGSHKNPLTKDGFTDGLWRWLLFDIDHLGHGWGKVDKNMLEFSTAVGNKGYPNPEWATFYLRTLLQNSEFKLNFIVRFSDLINTTFTPSRIEAVIRDTEKGIEKEMPRHTARWGAPRNMKVWRQSVDELVDFFKYRPVYQWQHLQDFFELDGLYTLRVDIADELTGKIKVNTLSIGDDPNKGYAVTDTPLFFPWSGQYFQNLPLTLEAVPAQGYRFSHWEIFGFKLTEEQKTHSKLEIVPTANLLAKAIMVKMPEIPAEEFKIISEANFDVYLKDNQLIYASQNCSQSETETRFFLHIQPKNKDNLPKERKEYGFDNLDFSFSQGGVRLQTGCVIIRKLPSYPIQRITTGQFNKDGHIWKGSYEFANNPGN